MEDINSVQLSGTVITDVKHRQNQDFLTASTYLECIRDHQIVLRRSMFPLNFITKLPQISLRTLSWVIVF